DRSGEVVGADSRRLSSRTAAHQPWTAGTDRSSSGIELHAWLGHRSPVTTGYYTRLSPTTLARAYSDAGNFARNVRTVEVLLDRAAVMSGAAAAGEPWQHYDLGHGCCTYNFFEQFPHRMACARCDLYTPKASSRGQILAAKDNLQRMLVNIPLT